jgi:hypothetical protein
MVTAYGVNALSALGFFSVCICLSYDLDITSMEP